MNQRIKQLAEQARVLADQFQEQWKAGPSNEEFFQEKFAQLIVWKFDDILVLEHLDCVGNKDKQAVERVQRLREKVKTYFGVEE